MSDKPWTIDGGRMIYPLSDPSANSREAITRRAAQGIISWASPLGMVAARTILVILAQIAATLIFAWLRNPDPLRAGMAWWQVTGTLVDIGCLTLLFRLTRREGIRMLDLIGLRKEKLLRDILIGLGMLVLIFPVVMIGGSMLTGLLLYGSIQPVLPATLLQKSLPLWAVLYARSAWWMIWSLTEEMTYNGYALPRLQVLTGGRTWIAVLIVGFGWAIQHAFLPFIPDAKVFLYLFLQMLPLVFAMQLLYLRFRRLPPLIIMHWGMDLFSAVAMISVL
jgi:hypothetical protein